MLHWHHCFISASSLQHTVDKFWTPCMEVPRLFPTNECGWMNKTTTIFVHTKCIYTTLHTPSCAFHVTKSCQLVTLLLFAICDPILENLTYRAKFCFELFIVLGW